MEPQAYPRMLDKTNKPDEAAIAAWLGPAATARLSAFEAQLAQLYNPLAKTLVFPFGKKYGWGYKYALKSRHLCHAFFEKGAFTVTVQLGDEATDRLEDGVLPTLSAAAQALWAKRYPCGERGGWVHYRQTEEGQMEDVFKLLQCKLPVKNRQAAP